MSRGLVGRSSRPVIALLVGVWVAAGVGSALALVPPVAPTEVATLLNDIDLSELAPPSIDPSGIAYLAHTDTLLVADSEVDEEIGNPSCIPPEPAVSTGVNLFELTRNGTLVTTGLSPEPTAINNKEPAGLSYNPFNNHVFISNDNQDRVYEVDPGLDGDYGTPDDTVVTSFSTNVPGIFNASDPEDVAFDTSSGDLFIAGGVGSISREVYRINDGPNNVFDGVAGGGGDDILTSFGTAVYGLQDLEGIAYRASSDTLLVVDSGMNESVNEFTKDGFLLRRIDIGAAAMTPTIDFVPSDVVLAPSSDTTDDPSILTMYIVDRGNDNGSVADCVPPPMDGRLYEMSTPFTDLPPFVDAGPDQTVTIGAGATLDGLVVDDGQPTPGAATALWSKISGLGTVSFGDANNPDTSASFSAVGTYVLRLTGDDSALQGFDEIQLVVNANPGGGGGGGAPPLSLTCNEDVFSGSPIAFGDLAGLSADAVHAIECLAAYEITHGTSPTTFSPQGQVTRWEMAVFLIRQAAVQGVAIPAGATQGFTDIQGLASVIQTAINQLAELGITKGTGPTTFSPNDSVPRWQMAIFLARLLEDEGVTLPDGADQGFTDIAAFDAATRTAINQLAQLGVAAGTTSTTFDPMAPVSRWQMALFLNRVLAVGGTP